MCKTKDGKLKISLAETVTSGALGTTSATGLAGMTLMGTSILMFVALVIFYFFNIDQATIILAFIDRVIALISIAAATLGVRKISGVIASNKHASTVCATEAALSVEEEAKEE